MAVPPPPVQVPNKRPLAPSVASVTSVANDKGNNEMILGVVHWSPGFCLTAEENPRKPQLEDRLLKGLYNQSSPQMGSLSSKWGRWDRTARQEGRRKEIRKGQDIGLPTFMECHIIQAIVELLACLKERMVLGFIFYHSKIFPIIMLNKKNSEAIFSFKKLMKPYNRRANQYQSKMT